MTGLVVSDQTLSELVADRMREVRAHKLFTLDLGAREVLVVLTGSYADGGCYRVRVVAPTFENAFVAALEQASARSTEKAPQTATPRTRARLPTISEVLGRAEPKPKTQPPANRAKIAVDIATRIGSVTPERLLASTRSVSAMAGYREQQLATCRAILDKLVVDGKLMRSERLGYVIPDLVGDREIK